MAHDEGFAERLREVVAGLPDVTEKKMFGGLCLMISGNMCCSMVDILMDHVPVAHAGALKSTSAKYDLLGGCDRE